jgi:glycosyltransferase involved in cell wall biosynthesis
MKTIKYIGYYDLPNSNVGRNYSVAASMKLEYIISAINMAGYDIHMISASSCCGPDFKFYKFETKKLSDKFKLTFMPSVGGLNVFSRALRKITHPAILFIYLFFILRKSDTVFVYHSYQFERLIYLLKKLIGFKLVLEVEEIYQDVANLSKRQQEGEYKLFNAADAFEFSTELLNTKVNIDNKPFVINYGTYTVEKIRSSQLTDKIHVVYAGTFDPAKGGAAAAAAAAYLPGNYHVHILGFGSHQQVEDIKKLVQDISSKSDATITYDGLLKGEEFIQTIQKYHIGLSTQNPDAAFKETSFPSKVLTYMANGLKVVSIDIPAIHDSEVGPYITYYSQQDSKLLANAIVEAASSDVNPREVVKRLDENFVKALTDMLQNS